MDRLPPELIFEVIKHFAVDDDIHDCSSSCSYLSQLVSLASTSRRFNHIATPLIYLHDVAHANRAILSGAFSGCVGTLRRSHSWGGDPTRLGPICLPGFSPLAKGTALQVAVFRGNLDAARYLLDIGADVNAVGINICDCHHGDYPYWPSAPWSSLHTALCRGFDDIAELLIERGASFVLSREQGNQVGERHFVRKGQVVTRCSNGVHLVEEVAKRKNLRLFKVLVQHEKMIDLSVYGVDSVTPLHKVASITDNPRDLEFMRMLLERGAKLYPDSYRSRHLNTQLPFDAAFLEWVKEVEEFGGPFKGGGTSYSKLLTFLDYFSKHCKEHLPTLMGRVLEVWMERGEASLDSPWSLLYHTFKIYGVAIPSTSLIREWILDAIRRPKMEPIGDMTIADVMTFLPRLGFPTSLLYPLDELFLEAVNTCMVDECKWLVENGANVDAVDASGNGALHLASTSGREDLVEALLSMGIDVHAVDKRGNTAMRLALRYRRDKVVALLKKCGAEMDGCSRLGGRGSLDSDVASVKSAKVC